MAGYLVPPTKNPGDVLTSALWNSYIRDNLDFGMVRPIADLTIAGSAVATIDFTSIPATFAHLMVVVAGQSAFAGNNDTLFCRMNADSGANYDYFGADAFGASVSPNSAFASANGAFCGNMPAANFTTKQSATAIWIPNYAKTTLHKSLVVVGGFAGTSAGTVSVLDASVATWRSTAAINELTFRALSGNLVIGTHITLYGMGGI